MRWLPFGVCSQTPMGWVGGCGTGLARRRRGVVILQSFHVLGFGWGRRFPGARQAGSRQRTPSISAIPGGTGGITSHTFLYVPLLIMIVGNDEGRMCLFRLNPQKIRGFAAWIMPETCLRPAWI